MSNAPLAVLILLVMLGAGCVTSPGNVVTPAADIASGDAPWQRVYIFDGDFDALSGPVTMAFDVSEGAAQVEALLTWRQPGAQLGFRLLDPTGEEVARGWNEAEGRAYVTNTHPVVAGEWMIEIFGERAVNTAFAATVTVHSNALPYGPIQTTFVLPPKNPARELPAELRGAAYPAFERDYAEVNLNMVPGDHFQFSWEASAPVYFNVHFHGADGTERPIEERGEALEGNFTADMTEVYALLWRNEGTSEVEIRLEMDGRYRLHSMTRHA